MSSNANYVFAANLSDVQATGYTVVQTQGHTIALFDHDGAIHAVDNRCPHMGFPLSKGTVNNGILTCHWHHARFCLGNGGTFDLWADDVRAFPTQVREDTNGSSQVWINVADQGDMRRQQRDRLQVGLERDLSLVMGKAVLMLLEGDGDPVEPFQMGLEFGTQYRRNGWGQGLTMHTCFMNLLPHLDPADRPQALYHGLAAIARDSFGQAPRFPVRPLPSHDDPNSTHVDIPTLKKWFRQFVAVRDAEGAERCIVSAIRDGATPTQMADMLFTAVTDYRYIDIGHPADFTNKAFEALDIVGWEQAEGILTSLVSGYTRASRMEESNAWRNPIDLVTILEEAFERLPAAVAAGEQTRSPESDRSDYRDDLVAILHGENPQMIADALLDELRAGCSITELAATVSYAAALRIAHFHTSNEFPDWDTALHTFTFANAIEQGLRRAPSVELLRGLFDAAMSVYLDRFLNIPAAPIPNPTEPADPMALLAELPALLDRQQQINQSAEVVAHYLYSGGEPDKLLALVGKLLLREDRDFHTIQSVEAAIKQYTRWRGTEAGTHALIAAIRYLAAHSPTVRAQGQTYGIVQRLHRGDHLFEGS